MKQDVEETKNSQHSSKQNQLVDAGYRTQRRNRKCDKQQANSPLPSDVRDVFYGVSTDIAG